MIETSQAVCSRNALYKSTFYLLTYLLTYLIVLVIISRDHHTYMMSVP